MASAANASKRQITHHKRRMFIPIEGVIAKFSAPSERNAARLRHDRTILRHRCCLQRGTPNGRTHAHYFYWILDRLIRLASIGSGAFDTRGAAIVFGCLRHLAFEPAARLRALHARIHIGPRRALGVGPAGILT